jgi:CheY-like chemotaxis protein
MEPMHIELSLFDLAYQHFSSMNHFETKYQLKISILVVDDAAFQRLRIAKVLSGLNVPVYAAASGSEMIQMLDEINPSVILLANHLSDIDSTTILEALSEEYPHIKVISMETSTFCHDKAIGFGAVKCLNKTCTDEELLSEVKKLL